jgi:hypothetical protein
MFMLEFDQVTQKQTDVRPNILRICKLHFLFAALLSLQVIIYDAWKLITPKAILSRWVVIASYIAILSMVWYLLKRSRRVSPRFLTLVIVAAGIALASFFVYTQRGMASRAVALYALPLATSAILASRRVLALTAVISVAAYTTSAISYFILHFNEGYKIELYGEIGFYSISLFILSLILALVAKPYRN